MSFHHVAMEDIKIRIQVAAGSIVCLFTALTNVKTCVDILQVAPKMRVGTNAKKFTEASVLTEIFVDKYLGSLR